MLQEAQKYQKQYSSYKDIPDSALPADFDWRNLNGVDFTTDVRNQGGCGSCYTVAFTQVVESRLKIKYGEAPQALSPQFLLSCNYLTEGCDGGWPHLDAYFIENGYMVSEQCAPYKGQTKKYKCSRYSHCKPEAKVTSIYEVGGAFGQSSEKLMMKEILRNGPLNAEFRAPDLLETYQQGIITEDGLKRLAEITHKAGTAEHVSS